MNTQKRSAGWQPEKILQLENRVRACVIDDSSADKNLSANESVAELHIVQTDALDSWLASQPESVASWVSATRPQANDILAIPQPEPEAEIWLALVEDIHSPYSCAHLPQQLPQKKYRLVCESSATEQIIFGWRVGSYQFDYFRTNKKSLPSLRVDCRLANESSFYSAVAIWMVRDLINLPASVLTPTVFERVCSLLVEQLGAEKYPVCGYQPIVGDELNARHFPLVYQVGKGANSSPQLVRFESHAAQSRRLALVGKGVCFDTGGLGIKAKSAMRLMKKDMGGAAHILALAWWIIKCRIPVNLEVWLPLVENAVGPDAMKPGDIVTSRSGYNIEIDNTDAEGRLILADTLFAASESAPDMIIDFATLTGAMRTALGTELPGFFATRQSTARLLHDIGEKVGDPVWQMPLHQAYREFYKSNVADFINCSSQTTGKAITAALFLEEFVNAGYAQHESEVKPDWIHFDVMGYNLRERIGHPVGGEAFGLLSVGELIRQRFASQSES